MRTLICLLVTALVALTPTATAIARIVDRDFHRSFDTGSGARLRLHHGDGDVTITPWEKDTIDISVRYHADVTAVGIGEHTDFDVEFHQDGDVVTVRGIEGSTKGLYIVTAVSEYEYTYTIMAPSYVVIESHGDDGSLSVTGWEADIECTIDDGDVNLSDIVNKKTEIYIEDGDVRIDGMSSDLILKGDDGAVNVRDSAFDTAILSIEDGDIRVIDSEGVFDVSLDDGDVMFGQVATDVVDVRGQDGDIDLDLTGEGAIQLSVSADDGDVVIRLSRGFSFDYLITMDDGDVSVDLDGGEATERDEHRVTGTVGGGEGMVRVRVADGDVLLLSGD
jgi:DUF4097 and DUF4098 domain-containing protein YvlB